MAQEEFTKEQFFRELTDLGESEVRTRIATKRYGPHSAKMALAGQWLQEQERDRASDSNLEQMRIARSAKNAAWAAAIAAVIAAISAIISIVISFT